MKKMVIVWHSMTGGSQALANAAFKSAQRCDGIEARLLHANVANADDMLDSDGYLFVFPENLAAISGVMKAFFDRTYYPCLGEIEGRPYAIIVCAGSDGRNAVAQAERIATGWRLRRVVDSRIIGTNAQTPQAILAAKLIEADDLKIASETGALLAEGIAAGIF
jgi:NAD(P)H-dependent FMN reductase